MADFIRLSDDAVFVFCAYGVFAARRFFARARTRMCAYARTHTPVQRMRIYYWHEKNRVSAVARFMILLRNFFHPASSKKQNCGIFDKKTARNIAKSGKKREIRLETTEKRLFAAMKGRYSSEKQ